jgi:hypothetical protein
MAGSLTAIVLSDTNATTGEGLTLASAEIVSDGVASGRVRWFFGVALGFRITLIFPTLSFFGTENYFHDELLSCQTRKSRLETF